MESSRHSSASMEKQMAAPPKSKGGWKSIKYMIGNESFEKLASMSLVMNMTVYLRSNYNMSGIFLVNVVTIWIGTSNISSLAGAYVSDAYVGKYRTLLYGSIASLMGMGMMTLTAGVPHFRPPKCTDLPNCIQPENWQLALLFAGLGLLAIGAGGLRPCGIAFGADQFDTSTAKGRKQLESFFNLWYLSFTLALIVALTGVVYIQTNISWVIGFAIPTSCLLFSVIIFLIGRHTYIMKKPEGSVFSDIVKVIVASIRKRQVAYDDQSKCSFYNPLDSHVIQTQRFKCLDKAAMIVDSNEVNSKGLPENKWRLCSLQQVENLKCVVGILPVWVTGVGCMLVIDQQSTFGVLQAIQMTRTIGSDFAIPPGWMTGIAMVTLSVWIFIYEGIYVPKLRKLLKRNPRLTMVVRVRIGIIMSILCMVTAGIIERKRRHSALNNNNAYIAPVHVFWLIPQFMLSGLTEAFDSVAIMEFFTTQMPESMKTVASAIFFITLSISSYLSSLIINIIHKLTKTNPWLGGHDLNNNRLDYYYYIIAGVGVLNLIYFTFFGSKFVAPAKIMVVEEEEEELQQVEEGDDGRKLSGGYHEL
ncbi:putative proton-dependent oligopeptide transporter family, MFS transporter superfamily [Helianthus annuus]|nr:putative proton-dependent oligopeptide transporter family, MFS transporter superfamily [Helianthus annuus]KAJ0894994.1 putative proton-dependent oligopeptide transporter family, MFS transporter superfamily [Helianthus annuus]